MLRFLTLATAGELTWLLSYGALGYAFGSQWEYISDFVSNFSGVLVGVVILGGGIYWLLRHPKRTSRFAREEDYPVQDESLFLEK